jgi:hypothetical protein
MQTEPQARALTFLIAFLASSALIFTPLIKKMIGILQAAKNLFSPALTPQSGLLSPTKIAMTIPVLRF